MLEIVLNPYDYPFWVLIVVIITIAVAIFLRFFSTYASFVYPNAKYEAIGNPFITENELNKILDVKNLSEFKDKLKINKDYDVSGDDTYTVQQSLDKNFIQTIEMMRKDNFKKMNNFYNAYLEKMDSYFIKNVLKNKLEGREINENTINEAILLNTKNILQKIKDSEKQNLPEILKTFGFDLEVLNVFSDETIDYIKLDITINKYDKLFLFLKIPTDLVLNAKPKVLSQPLLRTYNIKLGLDIKAKNTYEKIWKFPTYVGMKVGLNSVTGKITWSDDGEQVVDLKGTASVWFMRSF